MGRIIISGGGELGWKDGETLVGRFEGTYSKPIKDGKKKKNVPILIFATEKGRLERWSTKAWNDALDSKALKVGDVVKATAHEEKKAGKNRFRPFDVSVLTPAETPKGLRGSKTYQLAK